jgi:hypothetical protein
VIIFLCIVGYLIAGGLTANLGRNVALNAKYKKELKKSSSCLYKTDPAILAARALREAKRALSHDMPFIVLWGTALWPLYLLGLGVYAAIVYFPKVHALQSKAEREVKGLEDKNTQDALRKQEWDNALKVMEEAGMNTKDLRKLKID